MERFKSKVGYDEFVEKIINYITRTNLDNGNDLKPVLKKYVEDEDHLLEKRWMPKDLSTAHAQDEIKLKVYLKKTDMFLKRIEQYRNNLPKAWVIIIGQVSPSLKSVLEGKENFEDMDDDEANIVWWLLKQIKLLSKENSFTYPYSGEQRPLETCYKCYT